MGTIREVPSIPHATFLQNVQPLPVEPDKAFAQVVGPGATQVLAPNGIRAGQRVEVQFDTYFPPLPEAEGYGSSKLQIHYKVNGHEGDSAPVPGNGWWAYGTRVPIDVPADADGTMELRFKQLRANGTVVEHPHVYLADVLPADAPIIKFDEQWDAVANGNLAPGGAFKVAYDVDRLVHRLQVPPGQPRNITAFVSFDGKYPESRPVLTSDGLLERIEMPEFRIPADAKSMRLWFSASSRDGRAHTTAYDSDFGADFHHTFG